MGPKIMKSNDSDDDDGMDGGGGRPVQSGSDLRRIPDRQVKGN